MIISTDRLRNSHKFNHEWEKDEIFGHGVACNTAEKIGIPFDQLIKQLRAANPYPIERQWKEFDKHWVWEECCDKVAEIMNPPKPGETIKEEK